MDRTGSRKIGDDEVPEVEALAGRRERQEVAERLALDVDDLVGLGERVGVLAVVRELVLLGVVGQPDDGHLLLRFLDPELERRGAGPLEGQAGALGDVVLRVEILEAQEEVLVRDSSRACRACPSSESVNVYSRAWESSLPRLRGILIPPDGDLAPGQVDLDREVLDDAHLGLLELVELGDVGHRRGQGQVLGHGVEDRLEVPLAPAGVGQEDEVLLVLLLEQGAQAQAGQVEEVARGLEAEELPDQVLGRGRAAGGGEVGLDLLDLLRQGCRPAWPTSCQKSFQLKTLGSLARPERGGSSRASGGRARSWAARSAAGRRPWP